MPRHTRAVFSGLPHHVTQRGNHRDRVFFSKGDEKAYLSLLHAYATVNEVQIVAYCLMPNHIHLVLVPRTVDSIHLALRAIHSQYAQRVNRMRGQKGHLWQGRYFSSPLDANYFRNAVRYVELNPVRAGMVPRAEEYAWSSAAAHCGLRYDPLLALDQQFSSLFPGTSGWARWLAEGIPVDALDALRNHGHRNLPCGSTEFVSKLKGTMGRDLTFRTRGGQPKEKRTHS